MNRLAADCLLVACAAIWGIGFLFQKSAMAHVEPMTFVAARCAVAALVLAPFAIAEARRPAQQTFQPRRMIWLTALAGAAFAGGAGLQQSGLTTASVTNAGFLTALYIVVTPFVSYAITGTALRPAVWLSALLSFLGVWLLSGGTFSAEAIAGLHRGDMLVAASTVFWALHVVLMAIGATFGRPMLFTALQFVAAGLIALVWALTSEHIDFAGLQAAAIDILYVGVLSSALTFTVFLLALRHTTPTEAVIILSTEMLFTAAAAWLMRGEQLTGAGITGAAAILAAILIVQLWRVKPAEPSPQH